MDNFIKCFTRDATGAWRCIAPAEIDLPTGRVQVTEGMVFRKGERFMNVDLAAVLEEHYAREKYGFSARRR